MTMGSRSRVKVARLTYRFVDRGLIKDVQTVKQIAYLHKPGPYDISAPSFRRLRRPFRADFPPTRLLGLLRKEIP